MRRDILMDELMNMKNSDEIHANRIKELRKAAGMTQNELADLSGINIRLLQKYEGGESEIENMTLKNALSLAAALNVSVENLIK